VEIWTLIFGTPPSALEAALLGCLRELVLVVLIEDMLMRSPTVREARVVVSAEDIRRSLQGMVADAPATCGVAVHFAHTGIDANAHRADEYYFADVGSDTGPKVRKGRVRR
jgi:hypothetical protein